MDAGGLLPEVGQDRSDALSPLLREIGDLKRVRSAGRDGSIATRLFRAAWRDVAAGRDVREVALAATAAAVVATRLGDLDRETLGTLGVSESEALDVQRAGFDGVSACVPAALRTPLRAALEQGPTADGGLALPGFVRALEEQPRAGATCPGRARIVLQPPENHAEHCLVVAVYGVLLSERYAADPATVFLAGLAHHLHNAAMPDAGFTGEMLLGDHLDMVVGRATDSALAEIEPALRDAVIAARRVLPDASTPEGRAFHAADVLDRVLEIEQHLRAARLTMAEILGEMALVHEGPVKPFHDAVLSEFGLT